ncbi:MAG: hypothetical protein WC533_04920 [Candidatus Pacearchaeota archaeon]
MKKQILICLALALLLPPTLAFNCNSFGGGDLFICNSIQSTNLSSAEKDLLISDIFNKNKTLPNFDFVYQWNTNLNVQNSPDGKVYSSGVINNAWLKILSVMPSIIEDNTLYVSQNGKLQTEYNYKYSLPSARYKKDCKTRYYLESNTATLTIYLNGKNIGNSKLTSFNLNQENANFIAVLDIRVRYRIKHYRDYGDGCEYYNSDYVTDTLTRSDALNAQVYKSQLNSSFKITDKYLNITKGVLTADNFTSLVLEFNNSQFQNSKYVYSLNYTLPYYVLTLKAEKIENTKLNNIHIEKYENIFYFNVRDNSNCKIKLYDHFNSLIRNCDLSFNKTEFSIKTDKTNYYENDTIKVYITPNNIVVNLTYGNQTKIAKNYTEFKAILYENKISARLNADNSYWLVNVKKKENTIILYNLGILSFLGYFFYKGIKICCINLGI